MAAHLCSLHQAKHFEEGAFVRLYGKQAGGGGPAALDTDTTP
ncbi:MAG: hypothetical protein JWO51_3907 [Rhodospirillales bacterium]|jgi:hypothetical protein|nr:hypothetical protein [Rhodospirillales bacterium]